MNINYALGSNSSIPHFWCIVCLSDFNYDQLPCLRFRDWIQGPLATFLTPITSNFFVSARPLVARVCSAHRWARLVLKTSAPLVFRQNNWSFFLYSFSNSQEAYAPSNWTKIFIIFLCFCIKKYCCSITVVPIFSHCTLLPYLPQSQPLPCCPCAWVNYMCSWLDPSPSFPLSPSALSSLVIVSLFLVSMSFVLLCSFVVLIRFLL